MMRFFQCLFIYLLSSPSKYPNSAFTVLYCCAMKISVVVQQCYQDLAAIGCRLLKPIIIEELGNAIMKVLKKMTGNNGNNILINHLEN
jgi:hypothetical protein